MKLNKVVFSGEVKRACIDFRLGEMSWYLFQVRGNELVFISDELK